METPILTPMQQAVAEFEGLQEKSNSVKDKLFLDAVIAVLAKYLPKEQEAIEKGYKAGWDKGYKHVSMPAEQYFNQTYKETQNKQ